MRKIWGSLLLMFLTLSLNGQHIYRVNNTLSNLAQDAVLYLEHPKLHSSIRPFNSRPIDTLSKPVSIKTDGGWWNRKLWHESLVKIETEDYAFQLDPVVNFQLGLEQGGDGYLFINTRGYRLDARIGKKLSFRSVFMENQARFGNYLMNYGRLRRVIPGQSSLVRSFGDAAYDFTYFSGEVSYSPNEFFVFTAGQGRNFFGEGHRSLLLADATFSYPFFRVETNIWRFKYVNLWAQLRDQRRSAQVVSGLLAKKYMSSHYLSINLTDSWNFAVFESIIFGDTSQQVGLDVSFLNPVVFYRPVEFAVGSSAGNALLGAASTYKLTKARVLYGQFILDEFRLSAILANEGDWTNKFGWQIGFKQYDSWGIKGLFQRLEYNAVRPYTYSHRVVLTNYAHYGSPLAHPWGSNFHELILQTIYQQDRWEIDFQFTYGLVGNDFPNENWGSDVYQSYETRSQDLNNNIGQGNNGNYFYTHLRGGYLVNPSSGLKLELGIRFREYLTEQAGSDSPMFEGSSRMLFFGLRTELFNQYFDL